MVRGPHEDLQGNVAVVRCRHMYITGHR